MLTNPNTLGIFEKNIMEIREIVHEAGGLLVNIIAAVFSLTTRFKSSISTSPRSFDLTVTALKPIMLTNPNTLGIFEKNIMEIREIVHEAGGLLYYDGVFFSKIPKVLGLVNIIAAVFSLTTRFKSSISTSLFSRKTSWKSVKLYMKQADYYTMTVQT
jgi:hypothetical protein